MKTLPVIYFGSKDPYIPPRVLKAGSLQCFYQEGNIRHIKVGDTEIVRMIYQAVRDRKWGTVPGIISGEEIEEEKDSFNIRYDCRYTRGSIDFITTCHIIGGLDNTLTFSMKGEALCSFLKNRIGLNILHPIRECSGRECRVITHSEEEYTAKFPWTISPHQPMKNIRSLTWTVSGGIKVILELSGDMFEMEDQRNWTDASYKIYSTPLEMPSPVKVSKGDIVKQEARLVVQVPENRITVSVETENRVIIPGKKNSRPFPKLGLCKSTEITPLTRNDIDLIREVGIDHYRVDLHLCQPGWKEVLLDGVEEATTMELELELGLFFGYDYARQVSCFMDEIQNRPARVARIILYTKDDLNDDILTRTVVSLLKKRMGPVSVGTGTNANFAELNRNRPELVPYDFLSYSINPQVHAFDHLSLVENLEGQRDTVLSARSFSGNKNICISPVTLRPRLNAVATKEKTENITEKILPFMVDQRQPSLFTAGWTLASFKHLAESGVNAITYYETAGCGGIIHGDQKPVSPGLFLAESGDIYPVYYMFRELLKYKEYQVRISNPNHPLRFSCLMLEGLHDHILILVNHTVSVQNIYLPPQMNMQRAWVLDEDSIHQLRAGQNIGDSFPDASFVSLNPLAVIFLKTTQI